jgi:hypothetical protein
MRSSRCRRVTLEQATAIREVLAWIARKREPGNDGYGPADS